MKIINENWIDILEQDIDLERGKLLPVQRIKADAKPIDNITKFVWDDEDYEDVMMYVQLPDEIFYGRQIDELKNNLVNTDYAILKIMEGAASLEEYKDVIEKRKIWRAEINVLESKLNMLGLQPE